jgi:hypothetical protein
MNRRQEVACWMFGLSFAGLWGWRRNFEIDIDVWFVPLLIVGLLVVYSLRSRGADESGTKRTLAVGVALLVVVGGEHRLQVLEDTLSGNVQEAKGSADQAQQDVSGLSDKLDDLGVQLDDVNDKLDERRRY